MACPRRQTQRRDSGELVHGARAYRARSASMGGCSELLGWRWSAAVMEERRGTLVTGNGDGGLSSRWRLLLRARKKAEARRMACAAECGR